MLIMATTKSNTTKPVPKSEPIIKLSADKPSKLRASLAFTFASLALFLTSIAIFSFWVERTLTDTDNFVEIVGPLAEKEEVKNLISRELSKTINEEVSQTELANELLKTPVGAQITPVLETQLDQKVDSTIDRVMSSDQFGRIWVSLVSTAHSQIIKTLESEDNSIAKISVGPQLQELINLVNKQELNLGQEIKLSEESGVISLDAQAISDARQAYKKFVSVDTTALILSIIFAGLAVLVANRRLKMVRKLAFGLAVSSGLTALIIFVFSRVKLSQDKTVADFVSALTSAVFGGLSRMMITIFVGSIIVAVATTLIIRYSSKPKIVAKNR